MMTYRQTKFELYSLSRDHLVKLCSIPALTVRGDSAWTFAQDKHPVNARRHSHPLPPWTIISFQLSNG